MCTEKTLDQISRKNKAAHLRNECTYTYIIRDNEQVLSVYEKNLLIHSNCLCIKIY